MADTTLLQYLLNGDLIGFINAIYISLIGELFYGLIVLMVTVPIYIRTQSLGYVCIVWLLVGALLQVVLPVATFNIGWVFIVLGLAGILWKLFVASR